MEISLASERVSHRRGGQQKDGSSEVEQGTHNSLAAGSIPARPTNFSPRSSMERAVGFYPARVGSTPAGDTTPMKLKIYYRKNLGMSPGKIAAQAVHAAQAAGFKGGGMPVCVLSVSDAKFNALKEDGAYVVADAGRTEVEPGTETALAIYE